MNSRLGGLLTLALVLRIGAAWRVSLSNDEAFDYFLSLQPPARILAFCRAEMNPPTWRLALHLWSWLTRNELVLRLPCALLSVAAVAAAYALVRRTHDRELAGWVAAFLAVAYPVWLFEASLRMYAPLGLGLALALLGFVEREAAWAPACLLAGCLLAASMHTLGVLLVLALLAASLRERRRQAALLAALSLSVSLLWLGYSVTNPEPSLLLRTSAPSSGLLAPLELPGYLTALGIWSHLMVSLALWPVVLRGWWAERGRGWGWFLLAGVWLLFWLLAVVGDWRGTQGYQSRYVAVAELPFLVCLGSGLRAWLGTRASRWAWAVLVAVNLGLAVWVAASPYLWNQDWRTAARFIERGFAPGDKLAVCQPYALVALNFYLGQGRSMVGFGPHSALVLEPPPPFTGQIPVTAGALGPGLEARLGGSPVVLVLNQEGGDGPLVRAWFNQRYQVADALEQSSLGSWGATSVYRLVKRP